MKKMLAFCTMVFFLLPFTVKAEEKVPVYLFRGQGCPHCEDALEYFSSLSEEDKNKINVIRYEVWYNQANSELMNKVAEKLGETVTGVPYIVVGEKSFSGFDDSVGEAIMRIVNEMQESKEIIDIVSDIEVADTKEETGEITITPNTTTEENDNNSTTSGTKESNSNNTVVMIGVFGTIIVSIALLIFARKNME